jgi:hypothetical protein
MMRIQLLITFLYVAVWAAPGTLRQPVDSGAGESKYKELYENGFYDEAIALLQSKIRERPESTDIESFSYLAFCYIVSGRPDSAAPVFTRILDADSSFSLDTISISPKILEGFQSARERWRMRHAQSIKPADTVASKAPVAVPVQIPAIPAIVPLAPAPVRDDWYRYALYAMPGGTGQFYNRHPVRGTVFLVLEAIGIVGAYWAFEKKEAVWDSNHGLDDSNRHTWERYSTMAKAGVGFSLTIYAIGVADCIIDNGKTNRETTRQ